jgi:hypothetical protein
MANRAWAEKREAAESKLAALARRQLGLLTRRQALSCGLTSASLARRVASGRYEVRYPGVYAVTGAPDSREHRYLAACLHLGRGDDDGRAGGDAGVWLAGPTAADLHGLDHGVRTDRIQLVTVGTRSVRPRPAYVVHRSRHLTDADTTRVGALPVTDVTWTLTDLAGVVPCRRLRSLVSRAVQRGATDAERLREVLDRRRFLRGGPALREIVDELSPLEVHTREELESRFLRVVTRAGCPPTAVNHRVVDGLGGTRYLDAVWLPERVWVELDSDRFHGTRLDRIDDQRRENALKLVGWPDPLRFSWADVTDETARGRGDGRVGAGVGEVQDRAARLNRAAMRARLLGPREPAHGSTGGDRRQAASPEGWRSSMMPRSASCCWTCCLSSSRPVITYQTPMAAATSSTGMRSGGGSTFQMRFSHGRADMIMLMSMDASVTAGGEGAPGRRR